MGNVFSSMKVRVFGIEQVRVLSPEVHFHMSDRNKLVCHDSQPHDVITYALPTFKEPAGANPTEGNSMVTSGPGDRVQRVEQRNVAVPGNVQINIRAMEGVEVNIRVPRGAKIKVEMEE